jgi:transposase-like protein
MENKLNSKMVQAVDLLLSEPIDKSTLFEKDGIIKSFTKCLIEKILQSEMNEHIGYSKYQRSEKNNARNGSFSKQLITDNGVIDLSIPRDRNGEFEPMIVPKKCNRIEGLDKKILSLYAKGMSLSEIKIQIQELYEADVSESLISKITDEVSDTVKAWQARPLESMYTIVYFDCLVVKVRQEKRIINKAIYVALGLDKDGKKDILGLWISENESAKFWLNVLTELKNRGVLDILIACTDNLCGMKEAIVAVYPRTEHQLCIVHQIRNSVKYVSYKDRKELVNNLKQVYQAPTEEAALLSLEVFDKKWSKNYPQIAKSWYNNWDNLAIFFQYPPAIRKAIYTTNAIESVNSQLRKVTNNKKIFPNDDSVFKSLYLTIEYITAKWTMPSPNWGETMSHFLVRFEDRIRLC